MFIFFIYSITRYGKVWAPERGTLNKLLTDQIDLNSRPMNDIRVWVGWNGHIRRLQFFGPEGSTYPLIFTDHT